MSKRQNYKIKETNQKSEEWFAMREGLVTGSVAKQVLARGDTYMYEVLANMTTELVKTELSTPAIQWGVDKEPEAREAYIKKTGMKVEEVGFLKNGKLGLSPDGVVFRKDGSIKHAIEIKCPNTKNHIKYILQNKVPCEYLPQVIHNFIVIDDLETLDFVSYDPRYAYKKMHVVRVTRAGLGMLISTQEVSYGTYLQKLEDNYKKLIL